MEHAGVDLRTMENLREDGDFEGLAKHIPASVEGANPYEAEGIQLRLLSAEVYGREGKVEKMAEVIEPYLQNLGQVPFSFAARVLLIISVYRNRNGEPAEALRVGKLAETVALARGDEATAAEAIQAQGKALSSLNRWEEAVKRYEQSISLYSAQTRSYKLGVAYVALGGVLSRVGRVEDARTTLERGIRIMLKYKDEFSLAVARADVASALNAMGEYEAALKYLQFAQDTFEQEGLETYKLMTLNKIAESLIFLKEYDRAAQNITRSLEVAVATRSTQIAFTYEMKGRLALARGDMDKAERTLHSSVEMADQAGSQLQKAETRRTLGRVLLAQGRPADAVKVLREGLESAIESRARLLELEIKALLSEAIYPETPVEAVRYIAEVEAEMADRELPELRKITQVARKQIDSLDHEHYFIISDARMPTLSEARVAMLKWLWARALYKARGNAREAAEQLDVTPTYIRKLTKLIPRDLLRPGRKRSKRRRGSSSLI
jgi:tetratricopeptide (TPR) repeat protein